MKVNFIKIIKCLIIGHDWRYYRANYISNKNVFKCICCGKKVEE